MPYDKGWHLCVYLFMIAVSETGSSSGLFRRSSELEKCSLTEIMKASFNLLIIYLVSYSLVQVSLCNQGWP